MPRSANHQATTLHRVSKGLDRLIGLSLCLSACLLVAGLFAPSLTVRSLVFFGQEVSILRVLTTLFTKGEYVLFMVILLFSIFFPVLKIVLGVKLWYFVDIYHPNLKKTLKWIETVGKWSMLDVFVVALTVVAVNLSIISDVAIHAGIYLFGGSVMLSMLALGRLDRLAHAALERSGDGRNPQRRD